MRITPDIFLKVVVTRRDAWLQEIARHALTYCHFQRDHYRMTQTKPYKRNFQRR